MHNITANSLKDLYELMLHTDGLCGTIEYADDIIKWNLYEKYFIIICKEKGLLLVLLMKDYFIISVILMVSLIIIKKISFMMIIN